MDGIKPRVQKNTSGAPMQHRRVSHGLRQAHATRIRRPGQGDRAQKLVRSVGKAAVYTYRKSYRMSPWLKLPIIRAWYKWLKILSHRQRVAAMVMAGVVVISVIGAAIQPYIQAKPPDLSDAAREVLPEPNQRFGELLKFNAETGKYLYNDGYTGAKNPESALEGAGTPRINAEFSLDPAQGVKVTDPVNQIDFSLKPTFKLGTARQDQNQLFYPLFKGQGYLVYTAKISGVKEDILLDSFIDDEMSFEYEMSLQNGLEARLESDGSIGVYGTDLPINGQVSTGSDKDAELLEKARAKASKNKLVFRIPAPVVVETNRTASVVDVKYELEGNKVRVVAKNLKEASYPLSIDPSVYVETAQKLMRGNNETNLDFDVDNELIQKGKLTGGRFDSWTATLGLPAARWGHATAVAGGYVYVTGGSSGSTNQSTVYWSKFNTSTYALESPNPGTGACTNWCTETVYNLPAARTGHSMVAYNGFLYVIGGVDGTGARTNTVYISKIGANGEPSLWHPTDTNQNNWTYWYTSTVNLTSERSYAAAAAYNNQLYLVGGQTNASSGGVTTVEYASLTPLGTFGSWTTSGMVALPSARHNHGIQIYNDRMYLIGGNSGGTLQNTVQYIRIANAGTMLGSWTSTQAFTTARMSWGGNFSAIWGGFLYISGGCTALSGTNCSTIAGDTQLASINADGSITAWKSIAGVTSARMGFGLVSWRNTLYGIGGCTAHDTATGNCTTTATATEYGRINQDGDASSTADSVANGTGTCSGSDPYNCDMPPVGNGNGQSGRMSGGTIVANGFLYHIGGCTDASQGSVCFAGNAGKASDTISYAAIAADGSLRRVAACSAAGLTFVGSWCVDNSRTINGNSGLAAFAYTYFNGVIYAIGGTDGTQWQSTVWRNPLNADGSLGAWATQTFANLDLGGPKGYAYAFTRANPTQASTYPGNLYLIGGCMAGTGGADNGLGCSTTMYTEVYKCSITPSGTLEEADSNDCTTAGQLQLDSEPGTAGSQGLATMAGTVYANYIYLIGGKSNNESERGSIMYAKIDNSNNIVDADNETSIDNIWTTSGSTISPVREHASAFGYNGYLYALAGYNNGSSLSDLMYAKIDVSDGSIGSFTVSTVTVNPRWDARAIVNSGYVYLLGGCAVGNPPFDCTSITGSVQIFQLYNNASGTPAGYAATNLFATDRYAAGATILNGYMYVAGGCGSTASDCTATTNGVQFTAINPDGTLGTWGATTAIPAARAHGQLEAVGGTLYFIGGQPNTATDERAEVYYATPTSTGTVSSWATASNILPGARTHHSATVWNNRIYVAGGLDVNGAVTNTVYVSPSLASGGNITSAWSATTSFNVSRSGTTVVAYANNLYIFGGYNGAQYLNDTQYAKINADGTVGSWSYSSSLPTTLRQADGFAANGFMYLIGGRSADTSCPSNTIVAPISANTTIASGNNPTGIGEWFETNIKYTGNRYAAAVTYSDGKAYVLGGACGSTLALTAANRVVATTVQAQPQIAKYSRMIDTDLDVFPTKWLMNGLDNDIGARWRMRYRSSTNAAASWGQETNFGTVTLGQPENYIPLDGAGANTNFARYFYMAMSIDSSQAFGYPEDVARGPTIADVTLFFTSNPDRRMRHGKTFTGGELQPHDTPFP